MAKEDIEKFKSDITELREIVREAAASVRNHAAEIREMGLKVSGMTKTAEKFKPGPGSVGKFEYEELLQELDKLRNLAISLKDDEKS